MLATFQTSECDTQRGRNHSDQSRGEIINQESEVDHDLPPDECWLFRLPKLKSSSASHRRPFEPIILWLREVFDSPESFFHASRCNLLNRLETILLSGGPISAYRFGGSVPSLNLTASIPGSNLSNGQMYSRDLSYPSAAGDCAFCSPNQRVSSWSKAGSSDSLPYETPSQGIISQHQRPDTSPGASINRATSTFARVNLPKYSLPPQYSVSHQRRLSNISSNSASQLSHSVGAVQGLPNSVSTAGSFDELQPCAGSKTNVQEIARIQEDNLKAEVAALAAVAGRRGSQHSVTSLGRRSPDGGGSGNVDFSYTSADSGVPDVLTSNHPLFYLANTTRSSDDPSLLTSHVSQQSTNSVNLYHAPPHDQVIGGIGQLVMSSQPSRLSHVVPYHTATDQSIKPTLLPSLSSVHTGIPVSDEQRNQFGFRSIRRPTAPLTSRSSMAGSVSRGGY